MRIVKIVAALTLSLTGTHAAAANLWHVPSDEGFTIFFDGDQLGKAAGDLTAAVYYMDGPLTAVQRFAELHVEFDCAARRVRAAKTLVYDADFKLVPEQLPFRHGEWEKADNGVMGTILTNFACGPRDEWPRLGRKLSEQNWQAAMKQQFAKQNAGQAPAESNEDRPR